VQKPPNRVAFASTYHLPSVTLFNSTGKPDAIPGAWSGCSSQHARSSSHDRSKATAQSSGFFTDSGNFSVRLLEVFPGDQEIPFDSFYMFTATYRALKT
jgi:hypothetical protein